MSDEEETSAQRLKCLTTTTTSPTATTCRFSSMIMSLRTGPRRLAMATVESTGPQAHHFAHLTHRPSIRSTRRSCCRSCFRNCNLKLATARRSTPMWASTSNKSQLMMILTLLVISLAITITSGQQNLELTAGFSEAGANSNQQQQQQQPLAPVISQQQQQPKAYNQRQEILVQPESEVRIECRIPRQAAYETNSGPMFYWNFQKSSSDGNIYKPELICYKTNCESALALGIKPEVNPLNGTYDLLISNVSHELHDGIYYCDYKDATSKIYREIRLTVLIPPQPPTIGPVSQAPAREGQEYQLSCLSAGGNPEPNITWFRNDQQLVSGGAGPVPVRIEQVRQSGSTNSTLTWIPTIDDHQAIYRCSVSNKAMSGLAPFERELTLAVEYAPRISVGPFNPMRVLQGDRTTLSCQVDANPPVKGIRWLLDGQTISNHFNHTLHEVRLSDAGQYACQADNGIAPILANLQAGGQHPGSAPSSLFSFSILGFAAPTSSDSAPAKSSVEAKLQLEVLYPPRLQVRVLKSMPLSEGDQFSLNCSADSSPPAHEFTWSKLEEVGGAQQVRRIATSSSPLLEFHSVSASDMGNYTCTAVNRLEPSGQQQAIERQSSASVLVLVRHKPGLAEIIVGQNGETELTNKTQIVCRAKPPGYPEPSYKFWRYQKSGQKIHLNNPAPGPIYTIYSAKADDEAKYGCMASNELGLSNEADGDLIVQEPPSIIADSARLLEDSRPPGEHAFSINFRASGKPEPKVQWFHRSPVDGRRRPISGTEMMSRFKVETIARPESHHSSRPRFVVVSTLTFRSPLEIDDRGLYSVEFGNNLSRVAQADYQLRIHHPPIPAPANLPIIAPRDLLTGAQSQSNQLERVTRTKAGFNVGETVNLTCRVSAWPQPVFEWYSSATQDKPIGKDARYQQSVFRLQDDIFMSSLTFELLSENEYGDYMCVSANNNPQTNTISESIRIVISLAPKTVPDVPFSLEQVDASQDSVTIQWLPGFDGGFQQNQFLVQFAPDDGQPLGRRSISAAPKETVGADFNEQQGPFPRLYNCLSMNPCTINNLLPRQGYLMRLQARNELGAGDFSEELRVVTRANSSQIPRILDADYENGRNILHYRIEPDPEYLLNNLNAKIEVRQVMATVAGGSNQLSGGDELLPSDEWRLLSLVPIRQDRGEVYLSLPSESHGEQLRVTLCSRTNESLCGPEYLVSMRSAASSFLQNQRGLSLSILISTLILILLVAGSATTLHSCCLSRRAKKAAALDRADGLDGAGLANGLGAANGNVTGETKSHNGGLGVQMNGSHKGSHGSTTSTNSTSANGQLQSMDSITGHLNNGSNSDHSSDHSRQAKLDSMLPPNYNHYADRASLMLEQQQQQQQQQAYQQQQQHYQMQTDKLSSPFGLPSSALLGGLNQGSPMNMGLGNQFAYGQQQMSSLDHQQQQLMMDGASGMMMGSVLEAPEPPATSVWPASQLDDYAGYGNPMVGGFGGQQQGQEQMLGAEPTYGTSTGLIMAPQPADFDNSANQFSYSLGAYQQQQQSDTSQYQQEIVAAQQQMYGTLSRQPNYSQPSVAGATGGGPNGQHQEEFVSTNGLLQPPQPAPPPPPVESDYGTAGGRSGRLIREIIV